MKYSEVIELFSPTQLSAEQLAPLIGISNMTYRRWLKRPGDEELSKLHETGVLNAIRELQARGLLPSGHELPEVFETEGDDHEGFASMVRETSKEIALNQSHGFETIALELLRRLGDRPRAIRKVKRSLQYFTDFQLKNPLIGTIVFKLWKVTNAPKSPSLVRAVACGGLLYLVMPFDLIPDFTVGIGFIDDFGVLSLAAAFCGKNLIDF